MLLQGELAAALRAEIGLRDEFANEFASRLVAFLRRRLGAQQVYIPRPTKAERDAAIFREFDGRNAAAVMKRHGINSRSRLYQIVADQRALQQRLPPGEGPDCPVFPLKTGQDKA